MADPRVSSRPQTVNEILQNRAIRHAIYLVRVAGGEANWIAQQIPELRREVLKAVSPIVDQMEFEGTITRRNQELLEEASQVSLQKSKSFFDKIKESQKGRAVAIALAESNFERKLLSDTIPIELRFNMPSELVLEGMLTTSPIQGKNMNEWFSHLPEKIRVEINQELREGLLNGESNNKLMRRIRGRREAGFTDGIIGRAGRDAQNLVRTGAMRASNIGRSAFIEQNSDVVKGYTWVLTLDSRTCPICVKGESENPYPVGSPPQLPVHILCRCVFVALTKSWEELGIDLEEVEPGTRASIVNGMKGEIPDTVDYGEWFDMQSEEFQLDILGKSRFEAFKNGREITQFVDNGKILTIEELANRDPGLFN